MIKRISAVAVTLLALTSPAAHVEAKATWVKKAQAVDPTIKDFLACHLTKMGRDLNSGRGRFLFDKRKELGVKDIDLEWLRDYKEPEAAATPTPAATDATPPPSEAK